MGSVIAVLPTKSMEKFGDLYAIERSSCCIACSKIEPGKSRTQLTVNGFALVVEIFGKYPYKDLFLLVLPVQNSSLANRQRYKSCNLNGYLATG